MLKDTSPVLFADISRLLRARSNNTPTGIERVDLAFMAHLRNHPSYQVHFVNSARQRFRWVSHAEAHALIDELVAKWTPPPEENAAENMAPRPRILGETNSDRWIGSAETAQTVTKSEIDDFVSMQKEQRANLVYRIKDYRHYFSNTPIIMRYFPKFFLNSILFLIVNFPYILYIILFIEKIIQMILKFFAEAKYEKQYSKIDSKIQKIVHNLSNQNKFYINISQSLIGSRKAIETMKNHHGVDAIVYIHDVIPIDYPEYSRPGDKENHLAMLSFLAGLNARVLCNSQGTCDKILDHWPSKGGPSAIRIAHIGCEIPTSKIRAESPVPEAENTTRPFFVIVATIEGRKNHLLLLHLWRRLAEQGDNAPRLFVVGKRGWRNGSILDLLDHSDKLADVVVELNDLPDADMYALLSKSRALLFPSFAEGWGIPAVEAMTLGVPVICSDISELREATQDLADYIDPLDGKAWLEAISDYAADGSERREEALSRLNAFKPHAWSDAFAQLDQMIEEAKTHPRL